MAMIKYRREKPIHHPDGTVTLNFIEEVRHWPLMTCKNFESKFPDNVIEIDPYAQQSQDRGRAPSSDKFYSKGSGSRPSRTTRASKPAKKPETSKPASLTTESLINEEVKKI